MYLREDKFSTGRKLQKKILISSKVPNKAKPQISFYSEKKKEKRKKKERAGKKKGTIQYETNKQTKEYIYIHI